MRCPDCNKFVSYDEPEAESNSVGVDGDDLSLETVVRLNCAECGTALKEYTFETGITMSHDCPPQEPATPADADPDGDESPEPNEFGWEEGDEQYEVEDEGEPTGTSRVQTKDRNGKPIKSARYMKTFYGFSQSVDVKCLKCGETFTVEVDDEAQASDFEEC